MALEDLPDHLIHKIMHLLPYEEAAKFSVLSKSLYSSWLSFPTLNFSYKSTSSEDVSHEYQTFFNNFQKTLQLRGPYIKGSLHNLSIYYCRDRSIVYPKVFDALLNFAIENKVKELNITEPNNKCDFYWRDMRHLDDFILNVNNDSLGPLFSSQFLTVLKFIGVGVPSFDAFIACPKLEELLFKTCDGFQTINVSSSSSLKKVAVECCRGLKGIQILDGKVLHSFMFEGHGIAKQQRCALDISDCPALRVLKLNGKTTTTDRWLNRTVRDLRYFEELKIWYCDMLEKVEFENYNLKKLDLYCCVKLKEVVVDVPNLLEFYYDYSSMSLPISNLPAKCIVNIKFLCEPPWISTIFLFKRFLSYFNHVKELSLSYVKFEEMIFPKESLRYNLYPIYELRHLKLESLLDLSIPSGRTLTRVLKSLIHLVPKPSTITLYTGITERISTLNFEYGN
ncbi:hypothetical protein QN277_025082 [Acacia crassicarpa]|uniref:F-box domain-containing protein n=1 Tax=Acacia crassicarpa TaxID=499986 RepID=A0AAE1MKZ2_9FABA|nr:hypothetical protein QN277_025082 [Acacia crassicarpa]